MGERATTNQTTPHFTMSDAGTGIAVRADGAGRDLLFTNTVGCLCEFPVGRMLYSYLALPACLSNLNFEFHQMLIGFSSSF